MKIAANIALFAGLCLIILAFASRRPNAREQEAIRLNAKSVADLNDCDAHKETYLAKAQASPYGSDEAIEYLTTARDFVRLKKQCEPNIANSQTIITEEQHTRHTRFITLVTLSTILGIVGLALKCSATPSILFNPQTPTT